MTKYLLFALIALSTLGARPSGPTGLARVFKAVEPTLVQVVGAGGIKGVPSRGTGIIVSSKGHILTFDSISLAKGMTSIALGDGSTLRATVVARDPRRGLALLKADLPKGGCVVKLPPKGTKPGPGTPILLTGFPFKVAGPGEKASAFFGLIKARLRLDLRLKRTSFQVQHEVLLTDAPSNPGSQGGGLFNMKGELVGLVGRLVESTETNTIISYSIPVDLITGFLEKGLSGKRVQPKRPEPSKKRLNLGITLFEYGVRTSPPAFIQSTKPGSLAAKAGLRPDDLLLEIAGKPVRTCKEYRKVMGRLHHKAGIIVIFKRREKILQVKIEGPKGGEK